MPEMRVVEAPVAVVSAQADGEGDGAGPGPPRMPIPAKLKRATTGQIRAKSADMLQDAMFKDLADGELDLSAEDLFKMVDANGDGTIGLAEFQGLHKTLVKSTQEQTKKEMQSTMEADKQRRAKHTVSLIALVIGVLLLLSMGANAVLTLIIVDSAIDTSTRGSALTTKDNPDVIVSTAEATVGMPLYVAPVLPMEQLGAIRWLGASHLAVVRVRYESPTNEVVEGPVADEEPMTIETDFDEDAATPPPPNLNGNATSPRDPPTTINELGMVRSVFHIQRAVSYSATHVDFHTEDGQVPCTPLSSSLGYTEAD